MRLHRCKQRKIPGFTLIEVLVALALSVLLAGILFSALRTYALSATTGHAHIAHKQLGESIETFITHQLRQTIPLVLGTDRKRAVLFHGGEREIVYVGQIPSHRSAGGLHRNALRIKGDPPNMSLSFEYARLAVDETYTLDDFLDAEFDAHRDLLTDVSSVAFRYFGALEKDDEPQWSDAWERQDALPQLVQIEIGLTDSDRQRRFIIPIYAYAPTRHIAMSVGHLPKWSPNRGLRQPPAETPASDMSDSPR